jgi:hypothetical protein
MKRVDPASRRCEHVGTDKARCGSSGAAGNWDLGTGKYPKTKWLCLGHAIFWGVSRNPQQAVFEEEVRA